MEFNAVMLFATLKGTSVRGKKYDYQDKLAVGSREITFPSQEVWKTRDGMLQDTNIDTYMFVRNKKTEHFYFAGKVTERRLVCARTSTTPLTMHLTLDPKDRSMCYPNQVFLATKTGTGKFKTAVYKALKATPTKGDGIAQGIVPVHVSI